MGNVNQQKKIGLESMTHDFKHDLDWVVTCFV